MSAAGEHDRPGNHFTYAVGELLEALHRASFDEERVARFEWAFLPVLDRFRWKPKALQNLLADNPEFFVEVVSLVFRAEGEEPVDLSPDDRQRAQVGYSLLDEWRQIPGQKDGANVDARQFHEWIESAVQGLRECGRESIGLHVIGQVLSGSPADPDGSWPCLPVRNIIEELASPDLDDGIRLGVYNSRGVTSRDPAAGGAQERALAERYDGLAASVAASHPRTARLLRRLAEGYRRDARREDVESELGEDLGI